MSKAPTINCDILFKSILLLQFVSYPFFQLEKVHDLSYNIGLQFTNCKSSLVGIEKLAQEMAKTSSPLRFLTSLTGLNMKLQWIVPLKYDMWGPLCWLIFFGDYLMVEICLISNWISCQFFFFCEPSYKGKKKIILDKTRSILAVYWNWL